MEEHLIRYVHPTGYWYRETAKYLHLDSEQVRDWLVGFLSQYTNKAKYDLGCGTGYYLKELYKAGHKNLTGVEADPCVLHEEFPILSHNLTDPLEITEKGIVICLEVCEHIPEEYEHQIIDNIVNLSDSYIILSWAIPGQTGVGHFNCRSNKYVIDQLEKKGFKLLEKETNEAREGHVGVTSYFKNTLMIFKKHEN